MEKTSSKESKAPVFSVAATYAALTMEDSVWNFTPERDSNKAEMQSLKTQVEALQKLQKIFQKERAGLKQDSDRKSEGKLMERMTKYVTIATN